MYGFDSLICSMFVVEVVNCNNIVWVEVQFVFIYIVEVSVWVKDKLERFSLGFMLKGNLMIG